MSSSLNKIIPLIPIARFFGVGGIREGEKGTGTGFDNTVDDFVETGKIVLTIAFVNLIVIKEMVDPNYLRF